MKSVYGIMYCSHEYNDLGYWNDPVPCYFSLYKNERDNMFENLRNEKLDWFRRTKQSSEKKDNYTIFENSLEKLELSMDDWNYQWTKVEFPINTLF